MKIKFKRILSIIMCAVMLLTAFSTSAFAAEERTVIDSGFCGADGENLSWALYDDGELVINGEGEMDWYAVNSIPQNAKLPPWYGHYDKIEMITLEEGVTSIGHNAFCIASHESKTTEYYKINIPESLEFFEGHMFTDNAEKRVPGQHLAYSYAGTQEQWKNVVMKLCTVIPGDDDKFEKRVFGNSVSGVYPEGKCEGLYYNGEEPQDFCELIKWYYDDIDIVTHYYAPEAEKIVWYAVNEGTEKMMGEIPAGKYVVAEIMLPDFEKGDVYVKAKIVDSNGEVIASSENFLVGTVDSRSFIEKVKDYFSVLFLEFQMLFYILNAAIEGGLISLLFESWLDTLIWWN